MRSKSEHVTRTLAAALLGVVLGTAACGPKAVELPPPAAASSKYPDYIFPAVVGDLGTPAAQERHKAGWLWLQAGDLKAAERNFGLVIARSTLRRRRARCR